MPLVLLCSGIRSLSVTFESHSPAWLSPPGSKVCDEPAQDCPGLPLEVEAMAICAWPITKPHSHALHLYFMSFAHGTMETFPNGRDVRSDGYAALMCS